MNCEQQLEQQLLNKKQEMDTQKLTADYKKWLLTPIGMHHVKAAVIMRGEWKKEAVKMGKTRVCVDTAGVRHKYLPEELKSKTTLVEITPIGLNNCCFQNSKWLSEQIKGCKAVLGFNVTACRCGGLMSFEPHSCNELDGKIVDITKDFDEQKSKWFLKLDTTYDLNDYYEMFGRHYTLIDEGCRCKVTWNHNPTTHRRTAEEWVALVQRMEKIFVYRGFDPEAVFDLPPDVVAELECDSDDEMPALIPIEEVY